MTKYFREIEASELGKRWTSYAESSISGMGYYIETVDLDTTPVSIRKTQYCSREDMEKAMNRRVSRNKSQITKDTTF